MIDSDTVIQHVDYAERRRERALERSLARRKRVPTATIVGGLCVVLLLGAVDVAASWGRVHPGVRVANVRVGGMRPAAAVATLEAALPARVEKPVVITHEDTSWDIAAADIGLTFDYDAMVDHAMTVGRVGGIGVAVTRLGAWVGASNLPARPKADPTRLTAVWDKIAKRTDEAPVDASVKISGTEFRVVPGEIGRGLDRERAESQLLVAMLSSERTMPAPVNSVPMSITADEAQAAAAVARRMISGPVSVTYKEKSWEFDAAEVATWVVFRASDDGQQDAAEDTATAGLASRDATLVALISPKRTGKAILPAVGAKFGQPAKSATFSTSAGRVHINPSQPGIGPDLEKLAADLTAELPDEASDRTVELSTARAEPELTTEEARAMKIEERISRFTTTYDSSNRTRVNNIHILGDALDGELIAPGATFSFNGAVGERTAAKGYQEAAAIVNGKLVPQLGGGICQVGTTLFNTVFESGLPVVQRQNHSFYISHYPKGRDATVSWGGPDLKFKNDTKNWMLISVSYTASSITMSLYGTDPGYDVEAETGEWRNEKPFPIEKIKDPTMPVGSKIVEDTGVTGRAITVTRTVQKNGQIIRTDTFNSVYKPKVQVVRVGTKPKPAPKKQAVITTVTPAP